MFCREACGIADLCGQDNIWRTTRRDRTPLRTLLITSLPPSKDFFFLPHYDQPRCFVPKAPHATSSSPSVSPPAPPRARDKMDGSHICTARELMRWLTALLCFVEAQYDTLEKGNCTRHNCIFRYIPAALLYFVEARSVIFGPAMRLFCQSPDMGDSDYKDLHDQVSGWPLSQLAAAIFSSIPSGAHGLMFKGRLEKGNCTRYNCKFRHIPAATNHLVYTLRRGYRLHSPVGLPRGLCLYTSTESSPTCSEFKRQQYSHRH